MTDKEYKEISAVVRERFGIRIEPRSYSRIGKLVGERVKKLGLRSSGEYIQSLRSSNASVELNELINMITVKETYFFRDNDQCNALRDYILPKLIRHKKEKKIRIWSAGCSTGEEAYTIAIIFTQAIVDFKSWDIDIIGTDINPKSIEKARKGVYAINSFRGVREEIVDRYFIKTAKGVKIKEPIKGLARFYVSNIKLDKGSVFPEQLSRFDVIFCRNVLIYFEDDMIKNTLNGFANSLLPEGYLVLGHAEAALVPRELFGAIRDKNTIIYVPRETIALRQGGAKPSTHSPGVASALPCASYAPAVFPKTKEPKKSNGGNNKTGIPKGHGVGDRCYQKALALYFKEKYSEAEREFDNHLGCNDVGTQGLLLGSLIQINLGNYEKAMYYTREMQQKDEFLPDAHFIFGLIYENEKEYARAIKSYQAALFLNADLFLPHFRLGHLYHKAGNANASIRAFKTALSVIPSEDEERTRLLSGGFSRESLKGICRRWAEGGIS